MWLVPPVLRINIQKGSGFHATAVGFAVLTKDFETIPRA